ncbi:hypothetical protein AB6A40_000430 [Gnathostoma spinigerum]|uniref:Uncharacterized protein n=1 Tax=Gnathostoma spinigerum TaxID=75299 RepID=A0ABD6E8P3_9BILA
MSTGSFDSSYLKKPRRTKCGEIDRWESVILYDGHCNEVGRMHCRGFHLGYRSSNNKIFHLPVHFSERRVLYNSTICGGYYSRPLLASIPESSSFIYSQPFYHRKEYFMTHKFSVISGGSGNRLRTLKESREELLSGGYLPPVRTIRGLVPFQTLCGSIVERKCTAFLCHTYLKCSPSQGMFMLTNGLFAQR